MPQQRPPPRPQMLRARALPRERALGSPEPAPGTAGSSPPLGPPPRAQTDSKRRLRNWVAWGLLEAAGCMVPGPRSAPTPCPCHSPLCHCTSSPAIQVLTHPDAHWKGQSHTTPSVTRHTPLLLKATRAHFHRHPETREGVLPLYGGHMSRMMVMAI